MAYLSSFCIGSYASLPEQAFTIAGVDVTVPAGTYYLFDANDALSLLAQMEAAMVAAGLADAAVFLTEAGHVRMTAGGAFTVVWGTGGALLRQLLGFGLVIAGLAAYTAVDKSPLFWSPGKPASFLLTPIGVRGALQYNVTQAVAPNSGTSESLHHGTLELQRFTWSSVDATRIRTTTGAAGEFGVWYAYVAVPSARWKLYHNATEDDASTTAFTYDSALGPYIATLGGKGAGWVYDRSKGAEWTDLVCDVDLRCHVCLEIT